MSWRTIVRPRVSPHPIPFPGPFARPGAATNYRASRSRLGVRPIAPSETTMRTVASAYRFLHRYRANTPEAL